jgi:hypothetical protein
MSGTGQADERSPLRSHFAAIEGRKVHRFTTSETRHRLLGLLEVGAHHAAPDELTAFFPSLW